MVIIVAGQWSYPLKSINSISTVKENRKVWYFQIIQPGFKATLKYGQYILGYSSIYSSSLALYNLP